MTQQIRLFIKHNQGWFFILPALIVLFFVLFYPLLNAFGLSFCSLSPQLETKFVGFANFRAIANPESYFINGLKNSLIFTMASVLLHLLIGMALALLLNMNVKMRGLFRTLLLTPWMITPIVVGITWSWLLNAQYGMVNYVLTQARIIQAFVPWLAEPTLAMLSVIIANAWRGTPYVMLMILAGLQAVPRELYEAAAVDGASRWQSFRFVTLPCIRYVLTVTIVLDTIWGFKFFDLIAVMTAGGPGRATEVLPVLIYRTSFDYYEFGQASALAVVMFVIIFAISALYLRTLRVREGAES